VTEKPFEMQISERELTQMTADLDEMHREALPRMHEAVSEWAEVRGGLVSAGDSIANARTSRRGFLMGGAAVLGGIALAACGGNSSKSTAAKPGGATNGASINAGGQTLTGDLAVVGLATALENLAVGTYQAGIDAATAGHLGTVPMAVVNFATTAQQQHKDHAAAWNAILRSAGTQEVTGVDMTVKTGVVDPAFAQVKDVGGLAKLALTLENVAAATYLEGIGLVKDAGGIKTAATIQPVEMQHAAILNFVLGQYPVPDTFAKSDGARGLDDKIG
jgi:hypothetical protein